jgi:hypothetical protein
MTPAPRKDPRNLGAGFSAAKAASSPAVPIASLVAGRFSVVMAERVFLALLRSEVDRLSDRANDEDLRRFLGHFFDPLITVEERNSYVANFQRQPPVITLGYPRTSTRLPCLAIVLEQDSEAEKPLGSYLGQTTPSDPRSRAEEYVGSMFEQTYGIYIYAEHPDVCIYLYHFAKAVLLGSHVVLHECGIIDPRYQGNEMQPDESYMPENMFVRRLGVTFRSLGTAPVLLTPDPARVRIAGVHASDTVVSGVVGGVKATFEVPE